MNLGIIADDFTGASDIALTLAEGGMETVQYVGVPEGAASSDTEAGVVALKSRTIPAGDAVRQSLTACDWLTAQGAGQIVFKVCSTFDSTPDGNIGPVTAALAERLGEDGVLVCPAFPENGRSVYQGHLFVGDRLLSESGMEDHPLTPMRDPDLRRVLAAQTDWPIAHIAASTVTEGAAAVRAAMPDRRAMVIADAIREADLHAIGAAAADRRLVTGGSGLALGLPANFGARPRPPAWRGVPGPGAVLAGSCARTTRAQVARYRETAPACELSPEDILGGRATPAALADWALDQPTAPLLSTSAEPEAVEAAQAAFGRDRVAAAIEDFFAALAAALVAGGARRLVVAGGETAGAAVAGLGARAFRIGPRIAAGVPALRLTDRPLALALKSGNFGGPDFFTDALHIMEADR